MIRYTFHNQKRFAVSFRDLISDMKEMFQECGRPSTECGFQDGCFAWCVNGQSYTGRDDRGYQVYLERDSDMKYFRAAARVLGVA
jgi:hypothetical protein